MIEKMKKSAGMKINEGISRWVLMMAVALLLSACAMGNQKVVWEKENPVDLARGGRVEVSADVEIDENELDFLKENIQEEVNLVLTGDKNKDIYNIRVIITRYDEGNAFARFMLAGLGQMHLYGDVVVTEGDPPVVVREGRFNKNFNAGGLIGGFANMHKDMVAKVGKAIAKGLEQKPKGEEK